MADSTNPRYPLIAYLQTEQPYTDRVRAALMNSYRQIQIDLTRLLASDGNVVDEIRLRADLAALEGYMAQSWESIETAIYDGQRAAMDRAASVWDERIIDLLDEYDLIEDDWRALIRSEATRSAAGIQAVAARSQFSRKALSDKVYRNLTASQEGIERVIDVALVRGLTQRQLAAQIRDYVNPNTPGGVQYAAMRLARTEINNAYHAASVEVMKRSKIVEQVDWKLSSSHPEGDICDTYAHDSPYNLDEVPEKPHPHCFCFITAVLPTREQFIDNLFDGKYGDNEGLDLEPNGGGGSGGAGEIVNRKGKAEGWDAVRERTYDKSNFLSKWAGRNSFDKSVPLIEDAYVAAGNPHIRSVVRSYTGINYKTINDVLNGKTKIRGVMTDGLRQDMNLLIETLRRSTINDNVMVYRNAGTGRGLFGKAIATESDLDDLVGREFEHRSFMSTSHAGDRLGNNPNWAGSAVGDADDLSWAETYENLPWFKENYGEAIHMRIHVPKGHPGAQVSQHSDYEHENEILLPPGTRFRVLGWTIAKHNGIEIRFLDVEVLPFEG